MSSESTDLIRLKSHIRRLTAALVALGNVQLWEDHHPAADECRTAYLDLCGLAAELNLHPVPSVDFLPANRSAGSAAGDAIARWTYEAAGYLNGQSRKAVATQRRKTGRPNNAEKDSATKVVAALCKHHGYEDNGSIVDYTPATNRGLAERYGLSANALSRFLVAKLGQSGHKRYVVACRQRTLGKLLTLWRGELPSRCADLLPHEDGRGYEDD